MLPTFVVIGAAKCGTSSLHHYLGLHPEIFASEIKEPNFFVDEDDVHRAGPHIPGNWHRGLSWYEAQFPTDAPHRGEASHHYTAFPFYGGVPARMRSVIPDVKLIYLVRDPIDRIVSHYLQRRRVLLEKRDFEEVMADPENEFVMRSRYHLQLEKYLEHFPLERILVVAAEEMDRDRQAVLVRIFRFLGVADHWHRDYQVRLQVTQEDRRLTSLGRWLRELPKPRAYRRLPAGTRARMRRIAYRPLSRAHPAVTLSPALRARLADVLGPDADRLRRLTGQEFAGWSV
jgi:hypothetical protein